MSRRYVVRPKADQDLDDHAYYYGTEAGPELGHRFLIAAHDTFALLASQSEIGWRTQIKHKGWGNFERFRVAGFDRVLILYRAHPDGVDILRQVRGSGVLRTLLRREGLE